MRVQNRPATIVITYDAPTAKLLRENQIDLFEALKRDKSLRGNITQGDSVLIPIASQESKSRIEPLTIVASALLVSAVGAALERILRVLTRNPTIVTKSVWTPRTDDKGEPVVDKDGKPIYQLSQEEQFVEASESNPLAISATLAPSVFEFKLGASDEYKEKATPGTKTKAKIKKPT